MNQKHKCIDNYISVRQAAKQLGVQYFTLLSWIKKDIGNVLTRDLAVKKSSWLIHKDAVETFKDMILSGAISSREDN